MTGAAVSVRRRRSAAVRCAPLECGHADPLDCGAVDDQAPGTFGLDRRELRAELRRLAAGGWQVWELRQRFAVDQEHDQEHGHGRAA